MEEKRFTLSSFTDLVFDKQRLREMTDEATEHKYMKYLDHITEKIINGYPTRKRGSNSVSLDDIRKIHYQAWDVTALKLIEDLKIRFPDLIFSRTSEPLSSWPPMLFYKEK